MTALISWAVVGLMGQAVFTARFLVQWVASERRRDSVVPVAFWWLSLVGGALLLAYAVHKGDPIFILGQVAGPFVFARNLILIGRRERAVREAMAMEAGIEVSPTRPTSRRARPAREASLAAR